MTWIHTSYTPSAFVASELLIEEMFMYRDAKVLVLIVCGLLLLSFLVKAGLWQHIADFIVRTIVHP